MNGSNARTDTEPPLLGSSTEHLLIAYRAAALRHGRASDDGDSRRCNRAHDRIMDLRRALRPRTDAYQRGMLAFLSDSESWVRVWAACDVLSFAPERALETLHSVAREPRGMASLDASMALDVWERGEWEATP